MTYLVAVVALTLIIVVHEAGHMWMARLCGMRVEKFSVFFGPSLLRWQRGDTTYQIASIPLGGYVRIAGMDPSEDAATDDPGSYQKKSAWKRFLTIFAGPAINYLFAILIFLVVAIGLGLPQPITMINKTVDGSPAQAAGIQPGDVITHVNGAATGSVAEVLQSIGAANGNMLHLKLQRNGQTVALDVKPSAKDQRIGVFFAQTYRFERTGLGSALATAVRYPVEQSAAILSGLGRLFSGTVGIKQVGGPVEIVRQMSLSFENGWATALLFLALLNVYLGLFNLLPIPALDGGRLVFLIFELFTRRRVNARVENLIHSAFFIALFGLLILVTYGDIRRLL